MPNLEPIGPKLGALEGVKKKHKTGSGTKSRWNFKISNYRNVQKNGPDVSVKFQENRTENKFSGGIINVDRTPRGEIPVETRNGKLLCIPE